MNTFSEEAVLYYNPFEGDFGEPGDRILSDRFYTAAKEHDCYLCGGRIQVGSRYRRLKAVFGEFREYCWCSTCCAAMAQVFSNEDDTDDCFAALEARYALRSTR